MKNPFASLALATWLSLSLMAPAFAQDKVSTVPVHFKPGQSSSLLKGSIKGYDSVHYTVAARAGQVITVKLGGSSNANFNLMAPGSETSMSLGSDGRNFSGPLPVTGTYTLQVFQMRASARRGTTAAYTLSIAIR